MAKFKCVICGNEFDVGEFGNDPYPVKLEGDCCSLCNELIVIPARMQGMGHEDAEAWAESVLNGDADDE